MTEKIKSFFFENKTLRQTVVKNVFWLFSGQMIGRLLRAAVVIYAARILGAEEWGAFSYALGLAAFLSIFSDIGINALITKEAVQKPELKDRYLATAFFIKLGLLAIIVAAAALFSERLSAIKEAAALMPLIILVFAFDSLRDLGAAVARANEKMELEAGIGVFTNAAIVACGFAFLFLDGTAFALAAAYAVGSGTGLVVAAYLLRKHFQNLRQNFDRSLIKPIMISAWPFGLMGVMGALMINTDIIMLGWLRSAAEVGYYSAAQKPVQLLYVLPTLLATSVFPALSRFVKNGDNKAAKKTIEESLGVVLLLAVPLAAGGVLFGNEIINLLFGDGYAASAASFKLLMLTVLIVFPSSLIGNAIFAYGRQKQFLSFVALGAGGNALFNLLFIPSYGIEGSAAATIITQIISNGYIWIKMKRINDIRVFSRLKKILPASALALAAAFLLKQTGAGLPTIVVFAALFYFALLYFWKEEILLKTAGIFSASFKKDA
ncbi:MAG: flippase [Parcubacteria group bacterium]|nr:flippase [Parcubacteria group bacterium]